jgi:hypothetical protein
LHALKRRSFRWLNGLLALFLVFAGVGLTGVEPSSASPAVSKPSGSKQVSTTAFTSICTNSCDVTGYTTEMLQTTVTLVTAGSGNLQLGSTVGIDTTKGSQGAPSGYTSSEWSATNSTKIGFIATQANTNAVLETLRYRSLVANSSAKVRITTTVFTGTDAYDSTTGRFYEVVNNSRTRNTSSGGTPGTAILWEDARCQAKWGPTSWAITPGTYAPGDNDGCSNRTNRNTKFGLKGYLANITTLEEHIFLKQYMPAGSVGWIGGSDHVADNLDGIWRWFDGPESNQVFFVQTKRGSYQTLSNRQTTNLIDDREMFNYFSGPVSGTLTGEPNGAGGGEDGAEWGFGSSGDAGESWNDCGTNCSRSYYIIEYGGEGGETLAGLASTDIDVITPSGPTATSSSAPSVSPSALVPGSVLTSAVSFSGFPTPTKAITWQSSTDGVNWTTISGATSNTFQLTHSDVGKFFRTVETGTVTIDSAVFDTLSVNSLSTSRVGLASLVVPDLNEDSDSGSSSTDNITSDNTPRLDFTGVTQGATVTATATKAPSSSVTCTTGAAPAGGTATCTLPTLSDGTWSITATQNLNSQTSVASPALSIVVNTTKPSITATVLARDANIANKVNATLTFSGTVSINDVAELLVTTGWTATAPVFSGNTVTFSATKSGNVSDKFVVTVRDGFAKDQTGNTSTGTTETLADNIAPTLTMVATGGNSATTRNLEFTLSGNEPLNCSTVTRADFDLTKLRIDGIANHPTDSSKCLISAVSLVSPGAADNSVIAAKLVGFSVSDSEGVAQTSIGTGSSLTVSVTIANAASGGVQLTPISGTVPAQLPFAKPTRVMGNLSQALQEALIAERVVSAPAGSPGIKVESDLSHISSSDQFSVTETHTINTGEKIELSIKVSPSMQLTHDTVAYMKKGGTWFYLGRASFDTDWANSDAISLGDPGTYIFKVFLVEKTQTVLTANIPTMSLNSSIRVFENFMSFNTALTDSSVNSTSDQSLRVDLTVNGTSVPVAPQPTASPAPTATPNPSVAPAPTPTTSPRPLATPRPTASPNPTPSPTSNEAPVAGAAPTPTPTPSFSAATSIPPITPAPGVRVAPQPTEPTSPLDRLSPTITFPEINPGEPVANPAIGATGDDEAPPQEFSPFSSQEGVVAAAQTATAAVAIAAGVAAAAAAAMGAAGAAAAGAAGAAGAGGASSSSSSNSSSSGSNSSAGGDGEGDLAEIEVAQDHLTLDKQNWGDKLWLFTLPFMTFFDRRSHNAAERVARFSPFVAKLINDGAYLRAMLGTLSILGPILAAVIGIMAVNENAAEIAAGDYSKIITPAWQFLLAIAVLGALDASSGFVGATVFIIGSLITVGHVPDVGEIRTMMGIMLIAVGPGMLATAFRSIRKDAASDARSWWERATDFAIAPFMAGWSVSAMVAGMPAMAGLTLDAANHVADFAMFVALATVIRVLLEEFAARSFPYRLNKINPDEIPDPSNLQKAIVLVIKYGIWVFIGGALIGPSWQVWVGSALFVFPAVLSWYQDRFPNSPAIWRVLPTGVPGLAFTLFVASATTATVGAVLGSTPELAQWAFFILPMPLLILSVLGMFGRHGKISRRGKEEERFSQKNDLVYRVGGVLMLVVTLKLAGVI